MNTGRRTKKQIMADIEMGSKVCPTCLKRKELLEFYKRNSTKDGRYSECKKCNDLRRSEWKKDKPLHKRVYLKQWKLMGRFGLTLDDYVSMMDEQKGCCLVCGGSLDSGAKQSPCVDHDHNTGKVRGLLCNRCNRGIGMLGDNYESVLKAAEYLKGVT